MDKFETLNEKIAALGSEIELLELRKKTLEAQRQKVCPHKRIERSGGEEWYDYFEKNNHGYNPYILRCLDCGLSGSSNRYDNGKENKDYPIYEGLSELVKIRSVIVRQNG
jgi:hypothetical protein